MFEQPTRQHLPRLPPLTREETMCALAAPDTAHAGRLRPMLTATRLKVSLTLNAAELLAVPAREGRPRVTLRISLPDRFVTAEITAKSLRKAQTTIRDAGVHNIALVLQGRLTASDTIAEAGLSAQPRAAKPMPP